MNAPLFWKKLLVRTGIARMLPSVRRLLDGGAEFLHYYGDQVLAAPLDELLDETTFPEAHGPDVIHLALSAPRPDAATVPNVRSHGERRGALDPRGLMELRTEIATRRFEDLGQRLNPGDEVLITHGGTGAFRTVIDAFINPGHSVVLLDPTSPIFRVGLKHRRARIRWVPSWLEEGRCRFHMQPFVRAMKGARMLILSDPATPTGGTLAPEDLEQIAWWANHYDVLIYLDESFSRFRYEGEEVNRLPTLPAAERRILTVGSVSKGHSLPGLRVGWLAGCRHLVRACALTSTLTTPFVPPLCQQMALSALRAEPEGNDPLRTEFAAKRRFTFDRLRATGVNPGWPAGGFFFWVPVEGLGMTGREFALGLLRSKKVLVHPGDAFGPSGTNYVRLSYADDEGRLREGVSRLTEYVRELRTVPEPLPQTEAQPAAA